MKKTLMLLTACIIGSYSFGQYTEEEMNENSAKAKEILDNAHAKIESYLTIKAEFTFKLINKQEGVNDTKEGQVFVKGDKYKLVMPNADIFCNGETVWTYLKNEYECNVTNADEADDSFLNPAKIFTKYKTGFKYRLFKEYTENGKEYAEIHLFPLEPGKEKYSRIVVVVDKTNAHIQSFIQKDKSGTDYIIEIKQFSPNFPLTNSFFEFKQEDHPDVEVIDMR